MNAKNYILKAAFNGMEHDINNSTKKTICYFCESESFYDDIYSIYKDEIDFKRKAFASHFETPLTNTVASSVMRDLEKIDSNSRIKINDSRIEILFYCREFVPYTNCWGTELKITVLKTKTNIELRPI